MPLSRFNSVAKFSPTKLNQTEFLTKKGINSYLFTEEALNFSPTKRNLLLILEISHQPVGEKPGRIVWPQVLQTWASQTEKFSRYTLILYFSPIQYWRNCRKNFQIVSDRSKIIEKFCQPADKNGHVLLPGWEVPHYLTWATVWRQ